jgi:hypothetical protein
MGTFIDPWPHCRLQQWIKQFAKDCDAASVRTPAGHERFGQGFGYVLRYIGFQLDDSVILRPWQASSSS